MYFQKLLQTSIELLQNRKLSNFDIIFISKGIIFTLIDLIEKNMHLRCKNSNKKLSNEIILLEYLNPILTNIPEDGIIDM